LNVAGLAIIGKAPQRVKNIESVNGVNGGIELGRELAASKKTALKMGLPGRLSKSFGKQPGSLRIASRSRNLALS